MGFWAALARQTQGLIGPHFTKRKSSPSQETKALLMPGMMSLAHASFYGIKTRTNRLTSNGEFLVTSMAGGWGVQP